MSSFLRPRKNLNYVYFPLLAHLRLRRETSLPTPEWKI